MKKLLIAPLLIFSSLSAQSFLEQNFEKSDYYFNNQLLNPYGMVKFRDITPGFIDNIFLNIILNPAMITGLEDKYYFYVDYRGERKEFKSYDYIMPPMLPEVTLFEINNERIYPPIYPQLFVESEPEPIFSAGFIFNPIDLLGDKFFIGGTYQRINKKDVYSLYGPIIMENYNSVEKSFQNLEQIQVNSISKNELKFAGDIFSLLAGYKMTEKFSFGFSFSRINYSNKGFYKEFNNVEEVNYKISSNYDQNKSNYYHHNEYSFGLSYTLDEKTNIGIKTGLLSGKVDQTFNYLSSAQSQINIPDVSNEWNYYNFLSSLERFTNKGGKIYYSGFNFSRQLKESVKFFGYFKYTSGKLDVSGSNNQIDSNYQYRKFTHSVATYWSKILQNYYRLMKQNGSGFEELKEYTGLLGVKVDISSKFNFSIGISYNERHSDFSTTEPLIINSFSKYRNETNNPSYYYYPADSSYSRYSEESRFEVNRKTLDFLYQIPLIFNYQVGEIGEITFILNQRLGGGRIDEYVTTKILNRTTTINDSTFQENNIIRQVAYLSPKSSIYEPEAIGGFKVYLSSNFNLNVLLDPELIPQISIAQWWISLEGRF